MVFCYFRFAEGETIHHDFLKAIEVPLRDEEHITFGTGTDGFPAFVLFHGHDIKIPHKLLLPDKLYSSFSVLVTVKPENNEGKHNSVKLLLSCVWVLMLMAISCTSLTAGGYLFAVVDPLETLVQFGVQISPGGPGQNNISLFHTHPEVRFTSQV